MIDAMMVVYQKKWIKIVRIRVKRAFYIVWVHLHGELEDACASEISRDRSKTPSSRHGK